MTSALASLWLLHALMLITPGAQMLLIAQLAASGDRAAALRASAGIAVGVSVWALAALLGIDAVLRALPRVRIGLQLVGGLYLLYVAVRLVRSRGTELAVAADGEAPRAAFRMGLLTNLTNPKGALFFGSVFSQVFAADPGRGVLLASFAMIVGNSLVWHCFLAHAFSRPGVREAYSRRRTTLNRIAGGLVGAFGVRVLVLSVLEAVRAGSG